MIVPNAVNDTVFVYFLSADFFLHVSFAIAVLSLSLSLSLSLRYIQVNELNKNPFRKLKPAVRAREQVNEHHVCCTEQQTLGRHTAVWRFELQLISLWHSIITPAHIEHAGIEEQTTRGWRLCVSLSLGYPNTHTHKCLPLDSATSWWHWNCMPITERCC